MSEQTKPGPGAEAVAAFDKRFAEGGYQYGQGAKDQARGWFCHGYAAAAGPPREPTQAEIQAAIRRSVSACMTSVRNGTPPECDIAANKVANHGNALRMLIDSMYAAPPAASAAPKERPTLDDRYAERVADRAAPKACLFWSERQGSCTNAECRYPDCERASPAVSSPTSELPVTPKLGVDPPTPDDGRSDAVALNVGDGMLLQRLDEWPKSLAVPPTGLTMTLRTPSVQHEAAARLRELLAENARLKKELGQPVPLSEWKQMESRLALAVGLLTELVAWVDRTQVPLLVTPAGLTLSTSYVDNVALDNARAFLAAQRAKTGGGE